MLPGFWQRTLALGPDPDGEGEIAATLIRLGDPTQGMTATPLVGAVLAVHGYTDYFFQTELAEHLAARGFAFYALDLRKCGRSRRPGQTPHFITDLALYDAELTGALEIIAADNPGISTVLYGHSTGGLIVALWLDRLRRSNPAAHAGISAAVLNSPFLDLHGPAVVRTAATSVLLAALSRLRRTSVVPGQGGGGYGASLHRDHHGEFDYDLTWKPLGGFPITLGWLHAVRRGQRRLHRGLDIGVPHVVLHSGHSVAEHTDPATLQRGDAVLDVTQIAQRADRLGDHGTVIAVPDAKHDVFLSLPDPRQVAFTELDRWLDQHITAPTGAPASTDQE